MKKILIFPFNGNAREAIGVIEAINNSMPKWEIIGFFDDDPKKYGASFAGYLVLGGRKVLADYPDALVIAVPGSPDTFRKRAEIIEGLEIPRERWATLMHPTAVLGSEVIVGLNTVLMAHVTLTAAVRLGDHVVILPGTVVAHESEIGDYCLVGSNVSVSGGVKIGRQCYLGSGSRFIQMITVGYGAMVGLGSVVIRNVKPGSTVAGCPARPINRSIS